MNVIFHIGYHKTASSWLQERLFSEHPDVALITDWRRPWADPLLRSIVEPHEGTFDLAVPRGILEKRLQLCRNRGQRVAVVSSERLSGHPASGHFDSWIIARRLHAIAPEARVIMVVRQQVEIIASVYRQLVAEGFRGTCEQMLLGQMWKAQCFRLEAYAYHSLLEHYHSLFGTESVRVFDFAALKSSPTVFAKQVSEFMNIVQFGPRDPERLVNPPLPSHVVAGLRILNNFRMSELNRYPCIRVPGVHLLAPAVGMLPRRKPVDCRSQLTRIEEFFLSSNLRLWELTGIDFSQRTQGYRR